MKPDPSVMLNELRKRQNELQKIMKQMKSDNLHSGTVYKNLESELEVVKVKITQPDGLNVI